MIFAAAILTALLFVLTNVSATGAQPNLNPWYFTAKEIQIAYRYQHNFGKGLIRPLKASSCLFGASYFNAEIYGEKQRLPCRFIKQTLRHLKEILQAGAARYFFPLDLNHAHLAIPKSSWLEKYEKLPSSQILPAMLNDPKLVALYHSAEHLKAVDSRTSEVTPAVRQWRNKRNILGFYNGRRIKILPPHPEGAGVSVPTNYWGYSGFEFLATHKSNLPIILEKSSVAVDIKLDLGGDGLSETTGSTAASP